MDDNELRHRLGLVHEIRRKALFLAKKGQFAQAIMKLSDAAFWLVGNPLAEARTIDGDWISAGELAAMGGVAQLVQAMMGEQALGQMVRGLDELQDSWQRAQVVGRLAGIDEALDRLDARLSSLEEWQEEHASRPPGPRELGEGFLHELGCTVRTCLDCGCLVAGGPTRCVRCVEAIDKASAGAVAKAIGKAGGPAYSTVAIQSSVDIGQVEGIPEVVKEAVETELEKPRCHHHHDNLDKDRVCRACEEGGFDR